MYSYEGLVLSPMAALATDLIKLYSKLERNREIIYCMAEMLM